MQLVAVCLKVQGKQMKYCCHIVITGIVQGVGFRPFVYNLARQHNLTGFVFNDTSGVTIEIEGERELVVTVAEHIQKNPPPLATIFSVEMVAKPPRHFTDFEIRESGESDDKFVPIAPEVATCDDCLADITDPQNRRYRYPFTNCTNCGPRFTIVKDIPYDRQLTTMESFPMCDACQHEYETPSDRRFHAQPNACPLCGPTLKLSDAQGEVIETEDILTRSIQLLQQGKIVAIKGLGGYHLACDATNNEAVATLRARKHREHKPFALMVKDVDAVRRICTVSTEEEKLLTGTVRPIVLLEKLAECGLPEDIAPRQNYLGVMLPYTPLHHLLLNESGLILVMTSGNISSEPIAYGDNDARQRLQGIADYYLSHNREIHVRTDDSVSRIWNGQEMPLRRSRGYAPFPLLMDSPFTASILACGGELKNVFCLTRDQYAFMSHHIGDLENLETLTSFEEGVEHFKRIFNIEPLCLAYDLHPGYLSTQYALGYQNIEKVGVQHHHAHIVSCMADNNLDGEVIGVAFDGTGYGTDGKIWGGEFLLSTRASFSRMGHLEYFPLPGGEKAIKEPWRVGAALLHQVFGHDMFTLDIDFIKALDRGQWAPMEQMISGGFNAPLTSSAGRLFDAISALVGVRKNIHYEGQAAIELEMTAGADSGVYPVEVDANQQKDLVLLAPIIRGIVDDLANRVPLTTIGARFHNTMAQLIVSSCERISATTGVRRVALSGGVFQNSRLLTASYAALVQKGFEVFVHHRVPTNDGGLALGQAVVAEQRLRAL